MAIAIIEISNPPISRSGKKADGTPWGPIYSQQAFVHGEDGPYPKPIDFNVSDPQTAYAPGLYVVDASALYMDRQQRLATYFGREGRLTPLDLAVDQIKTFQASRQHSKAA